MRLLLDTSVLIEIERNNTAMAGRLLAYKKREIGMSALCLTELEVGVLLGRFHKRNRANLDALVKQIKVLPFDATAAKAASRLLAAHDLKGDRAQVFDALIAAHANSLKLPVACVDGDFNRFAIKKLSWAASASTRKAATAAARQR